MQVALYYPTIPRITPPADWSQRKTAMYRQLCQWSKLPRTEGGFYLRMSQRFRRQVSASGSDGRPALNGERSTPITCANRKKESA